MTRSPRPFAPRRRPAKLLPLLALLAAGLLSACSPREAAAPVPLDGQPATGGELVFAFDGAGLSSFPLDPHNSAYAPHNRIMRSVFDSLVVALPDHQFGPWLAASWVTSSDGLSTTFKLRQDVRFHDATRFDAAAVKMNLDRLRDPQNALFAGKDLGSIKDVVVLDEFTVRLDFSTPFAPLLAQLSKTNFGIISPAALKQYGDQIAAHPVGSGPFKVVSIAPGTEVVTERFDGYHWAAAGSQNPGAALLDRLIFKNVPEEATRVAVLQNGQAQAADLIPPQNLVQMRAAPTLKVIEGELLNHNYALFLNLTREPWNDVRLRRAFRQALDIDAAVKTIYLGTAARAWSPLSPSILAYDRALEGSWPSDRAAAASTLEALGWKRGSDGIRVKDGKRLSLVLVDSQGNREKRLDLLTLLRRQLKDSGFELRIDSQPGGSFFEKLRTGDYDLVGSSQFTPDPDVLRRVYSPLARTSLAISRADDAELTAWLEAAYRQTDATARLPLYAKAQQRIIDAVYSVPLYVLTYNVAHTDKVHGIKIDRHGFPLFQSAWVRP